MSKRGLKGAGTEQSKQSGAGGSQDKPIVILDANDGTPLIIVPPSKGGAAETASQPDRATPPASDRK